MVAVKAFGPCWSCRTAFWYGVATVPSVPVDRAGKPVDEAKAYRTAPICGTCADAVNVERVRNGLVPLVHDVVSEPAHAAEIRAELSADAPTADDFRALGAILSHMEPFAGDAAVILANADTLAGSIRATLDTREHGA